MIYNIDTRKEETTVEHLLRRVQRSLRTGQDNFSEELETFNYYDANLTTYNNIDIDPELYFAIDYASKIYDPRTVPGNTRFYKLKKLMMRFFRLYATRQVEYNATVLRVLNKFFDKFHDVIERFEYFRKSEVKLHNRIEQTETLIRNNYKLIDKHRERLENVEVYEQELNFLRYRIEKAESNERKLNGRLITLETLENKLHHAIIENISLRQRLDRMSIQSEAVPSGSKPSSAPPETKNISQISLHDDHLYFPYLNEDRGIESIISNRVKRYVPFFSKLDFSKDIANPYIVDIGCGRGEFIESCNEANIPCRGIEVNQDLVSYCKEKGYNVEFNNAISYLSELEDNSLSGLISCHVIEHFHPSSLLNFLKLSVQKLAPGGRLILETPNPTSLFALCNFYKDFTHVQPVHPDTLQFLLKQLGLKDITKLELSPPSNEMLEVPEGDKSMSKNIKKLNEIIYGHLEYAIFATK